jgi:transposase
MPAVSLQIIEPIERISELERDFEGTDLVARLKMLALMKMDPGMSLREISRHIGRSYRSVQRWKDAYAQGGLDELLSPGAPGRPKGSCLPPDILTEFRRKLAFDGFSEINEAQRWLQEEFGFNYSRTSVWNLLRSECAGRGVWQPASAVRRPGSSLADDRDSAIVRDRFIAFMNSLPTTGDVLEWITEFRESLAELLGDVDRVSLNVNRHCNLLHPETYDPEFSITEHVSEQPGQDGLVMVESQTDEPAIRLLHSFRRQGQQLDRYHDPVYFDYYYKGKAYLATMFLWRDRDKPQISMGSIDLIKSLEPFMLFVLSDIVARNQQTRPMDRVFQDAVNQMIGGLLSPQEGRVVILQMLGHSYKEMADTMSISIDAVKKLFRQVHRKTGTRSLGELFAKYFTNRYALPEGDDTNS